MPLLVNSVPNLAQGVSQQPDNLRYPGQCDEQINAWATVVEGLKKRPNTNYVKNIDSSSTSSNLFTHFVKRDENNQYVLTVSLGGVGVTDLADGTKMSVFVTSIASTYLGLSIAASLGGVTNPLADLRALTVADYTFVVNKNKKVLKDTRISSKVPTKKALIVVKLGDYEKSYTIKINDNIVQGLPHSDPSTPYTDAHHDPSTITDLQDATYFSGPSTGGSHEGKHADTEYIAKDLAAVLESTYGSGGSGETGISSLTLGTGAGDGGSGWLVEDPITALFKLRKKLEFQVDQASNTNSNFKPAKGFAVVEDGVIQSLNLTNRGEGYNASPTPTLSFTSKRYFTNGWETFTEPVTPVDPTYTVTVGTLSEYTITREGAVILIESRNVDDDSEDFDVKTEDGLANQGLGVVYKEVDSITDLPKRCFNQFAVKILGDADIDQDDYYVKFKTKDGTNFGEGSWVETVGWEQDESDTAIFSGIGTHLNENTMPITLVPDLDNLGNVQSFRLQTPQENKTFEAPAEIGWRSRRAGDNFTNPFPSFTDNKINDVFFFKNRLGFLTDSAVVFSEADEYFNFFRTTTQQLLDSAPIDVGLSHTKVAILQHAIPFQEKLMLFSKQSQFVLRGADVLSPKTVAISPVTEFDISDSVEPVALGNYIYFTFKRNEFEGMYEYFVDNNTEVFDAEEVTQQVPKYIPNNVRKIVGSQAENTVVVGVDSDLKTLYVYKYFWSNKEKIQSAWMKFTFDRDVVGFDFIDSKLYMITKDTDGLHLEFLTLEDGLKDTGLDYALLLDSRVDGNSFSSEPTNPNPTATTEVGMKVVFLTDTTDFPANTYGEITAKDTDPFDTGFTFPTTDGSPHYSSPYPQVRVINKWHPHITAGEDYDLVQVQIVGGVLNNMKFGNTSAGSQWVGLGAGRGVDWEVLYDTPVVYHTIRSDDTSVSDDFYENVPAESRATRWEAIAGDIFYNTATKKTTIFKIPYDTTGIELYTKIGTQRTVSIANSSTINVTGTLSSYASYSGSIYKCIETHTSTDSETPDTSAKWAVSTDVTSATAWSSGRLYNDDTYFVVGKPYNMLYRFSDQSLKQPTERGGRSASDYTFQTIRGGSINYADTGHFVVEVTPEYRDTYSYVFNPDIVGADLSLNEFEPQDGHFRFAVQAQPGEVKIEVKSDSALPCKLLAAEFESMFVSRSRRYGS